MNDMADISADTYFYLEQLCLCVRLNNFAKSSSKWTVSLQPSKPYCWLCLFSAIMQLYLPPQFHLFQNVTVTKTAQLRWNVMRKAIALAKMDMLAKNVMTLVRTFLKDKGHRLQHT